jgi:hypothetical protein
VAKTRNVFISHVHEDDKELPRLKELLSRAGMDVRDSSITSEKPNEAHDEEYIKREYLAPGIEWASTLLVLISPNTSQSKWVNWEIEYAARLGKRIVGVFLQGASDADIPTALEDHGDALVGWQGDRVVHAISGEISEWDKADGSGPRPPVWQIKRIQCQ